MERVIKVNKYLKKEYGEAFKFLRESKKYIYFVIYLFIFFALVGFFVPIPQAIIEKIITYFKYLLEQTDAYNSIEMIGFLFKNNVFASFFGLIFGAFFGIFSIINTILNGFVLGFAANLSVTENGIFSLWRIFPHGIFEIPALFISLGMGIRLGFFVFAKEKSKEFNYRLKGSLKTFFYIVVPLLLIAAIIEGILIIFSR